MAVVKEVDLKDFIAESEHNGVFGLEPLFDIDELVVLLVSGLGDIKFGDLVIEVDNELFEKHEFFLEVFVVGESVIFFPHVRVNLNVFLFAGRVFNIGYGSFIIKSRYFLSPSIDMREESLKYTP